MELVRLEPGIAIDHGRYCGHYFYGLWSVGELKHGSGQWPTNGATIKQVDRVQDRMIVKYERQNRKILRLQQRLDALEAIINAPDVVVYKPAENPPPPGQ